MRAAQGNVSKNPTSASMFISGFSLLFCLSIHIPFSYMFMYVTRAVCDYYIEDPCRIWSRCALTSNFFHRKLMAQPETDERLIKAQALTSQHMPDELLKIQVTPCEEINCRSSHIHICNMSALEAKWRLFFISLNQNGSLSLQTDVAWRLKWGATSKRLHSDRLSSTYSLWIIIQSIICLRWVIVTVNNLND